LAKLTAGANNPADELAQLTQILAQSCMHICEREVGTAGGGIEGPSKAQVAISCHVAPLQGQQTQRM